MMKRLIKISIVGGVVFFCFIFIVPSSWADSLGQKETFFVDSEYDSSQRTQVFATLFYVSQKGYFYIENNWWNSLSYYKKKQAEQNIKNLANEFDETIYPRLSSFFGSPWDPGIDNDSRITILMTNLIKNAGGYFDSCHEYSLSRCSHSNEREMLHINAAFIFDSRMKAFLAHELQHLINWNQKERLAGLREDVWLNETRSEYVPTLLDYNNPYSNSILEMRVNDFLADQSNPLGEWTEKSTDYGAINLFGHYLTNQFGENLFSLMSKNHFIGITSINQALSETGYSENFDEVFTNWSLANYYNSLAMGRGGKYGYTESDLKKIHISPTTNSFYSYSFVTFSETVKDWSPRWYLLKNKLSSVNSRIALKIEFEELNQQADFQIPYMIEYKDGNHELGFINLESQKGVAYVFNFADKVESILVVPTNHSKRNNFTNNDSSTLFTLKASTIIINQPVITSISPSDGKSSGGNIVLIRGGNFQKGTEVYFGGEKSLKVTWTDETSLNVVVPSHEQGFVNVWLKNPDGKSSVFAQGYEYKKGVVADGSLIRAKGDNKVYIVNGEYRRHILDSKIFDFYGHLNWSNVIEVTPEELNFYKDSAWVRMVADAKVYEVNGDKTKHWLNMTAEEFVVSGRRWEGVFIINDKERDFYKTGAGVLYK